MNALQELSAALEANKQLTAQVASIAGLNSQIETLTKANADLAGQIVTLTADVETQKGLTAAETAKATKAQTDSQAALAAKETEVETRANKRAVEIVAAAGGAPVKTEPAPGPQSGKPEVKGKTAQERIAAEIAATNPHKL